MEHKALARGAEVAPEGFVAAMRRAATGVTVVSTAGPAGRFGVTVSAMTSVSAEPPLLLVCVHRASPACDAIARNGVFCVNVLQESQDLVSDVFAGRVPTSGGDRFECGDWRAGATGAPRLADAAAAFDCRLEASHDHGSHRVFIGRVVEASEGEGRPLVYCDRAYRRLTVH